MTRRTIVAGTTAVLGLALAACGTGSEARDGDAMEVVTVSVVPSIDAMSLYVGKKQGFFEEEGIELEIAEAGSGPAAVSSVVGGSADFGLAVAVALIQTQSNNLPIVAAAPAAGTGEDPATSKDQLVVPPGSEIADFADLEGKTVAVVAVKNSPELFTRELIDRAGGDSSTVKFVEIPFPEMGTALDAGRVDAIAINEPFLTGALESTGGTSIGSYTDEVLGENKGYSYWFTNRKLIDSSPETVEAFIRAMKKSAEFADANPDAVREAVTDDLGVDEQVASKINLPPFDHEIDESTIGLVADVMLRYGYIDAEPRIDDLVFVP